MQGVRDGVGGTGKGAGVTGEELDRFDRATRAAPRQIVRARRLRAAPTRTEEKLWSRLRKLPIRFRRQVPIDPYVVDFACHRARLIIEEDGGVHALPEVAARDAARDEWLTSQGCRVLRFATKQVEDDIEGVMSAVRLASPLPLDGEGVGGWGGGTMPQDKALKAAVSSSLNASQPAATPSQPSPVEGEGFANHPVPNTSSGTALWRARHRWVRDDEN